MSPPLVSLLIVTYNHEAFIRQALEAALAQDYPDMQIVVSDDASQDGTREIITEIAAAHPDRVEAIIDLPHVGILGNCNRGLAACRGEYVAFQDGDDFHYPGKISRQVAWFEADARRVLCGHLVDVAEVDSDGISRRTGVSPGRLRNGEGAAGVVRRGPPYAASSVMVRARHLPAGGYDSHLSFALDWKLWIDTLASGGVWGYIEGSHACYRRHPASISVMSVAQADSRRTHLIDNLTALSVVEADYPQYLTEARHMRGSVLYEHGRWCLRRGDRDQARAYLIAAFRTRPWVTPGLYRALLELATSRGGRMLENSLKGS